MELDIAGKCLLGLIILIILVGIGTFFIMRDKNDEDEK